MAEQDLGQDAQYVEMVMNDNPPMTPEQINERAIEQVGYNQIVAALRELAAAGRAQELNDGRWGLEASP